LNTLTGRFYSPYEAQQVKEFARVLRSNALSQAKDIENTIMQDITERLNLARMLIRNAIGSHQGTLANRRTLRYKTARPARYRKKQVKYKPNAPLIIQRKSSKFNQQVNQQFTHTSP
jgi:hypothetical protein